MVTKTTVAPSLVDARSTHYLTQIFALSLSLSLSLSLTYSRPATRACDLYILLIYSVLCNTELRF